MWFAFSTRPWTSSSISDGLPDAERAGRAVGAKFPTYGPRDMNSAPASAGRSCPWRELSLSAAAR